jgi:hypothetical protein
LSTCR